MSWPRLFSEEYAQNFSTNGTGVLSECLSCSVTDQLNGIPVLRMEYPVGGRHWDEIYVGRKIVCNSDVNKKNQPFTIKNIQKTMGGKVSIVAEHVFADSFNVAVSGFSANNLSGFCQQITNNSHFGSGVASPFVLTARYEKTGTYYGINQPPRTFLELIAGKELSAISIYGADIDLDGYSVNLVQRLGADRGVKIRYGRNLLSLKQTVDLSGVLPSVFPYWSSGDSYFELPEKIISATGTNGVGVEILDASQHFESQPTEAQLRTFARNWLTSNYSGKIPASLSVKFIDFTKTTEFSELLAENLIKLGDDVTVEYPYFDLTVKNRIIETNYNVLAERYNSIKLGTYTEDLSDVLLRLSRR